MCYPQHRKDKLSGIGNWQATQKHLWSMPLSLLLIIYFYIFQKNTVFLQKHPTFPTSFQPPTIRRRLLSPAQNSDTPRTCIATPLSGECSQRRRRSSCLPKSGQVTGTMPSAARWGWFKHALKGMCFFGGGRGEQKHGRFGWLPAFFSKNLGILWHGVLLVYLLFYWVGLCWEKSVHITSCILLL